MIFKVDKIQRAQDFGLRTSSNRSRSAQIEMIGLVIVVILVSIGLLFYVKFGVLKSDSANTDTTVENAYVTNLMGSIFNIKICNTSPVQIQEGIVNCFNNEEVCGIDACAYVGQQIKDIIHSVGLKKYNNYSVWVSKGVDNRTVLNQCNKTGILTYTTIVTPANEHYTAYFRVC